MSGKSIKFGGEKVNKSKFCKNKKPFRAEDININKLLVSKKETYCEKPFRYLIRCNDGDVIRPLCIGLLQMVGYVKHFTNNNGKDSKRMSFKVSDKKLLWKQLVIYWLKNLIVSLFMVIMINTYGQI